MPPAATSTPQTTIASRNARTEASFGANVTDERPGHDDSDHRDADQSGDPRNSVVGRGSDPRILLVGIGEDGGRERRDREGEAERKDDHRREHVRQIGHVQPEACEQEDPDGGDQRPAAHEQPRPEPIGERPEAARQREHDHRHRQGQETALERRVAGYLLQVDGEEEEQDRQPCVQAQCLDVADGEVAVRKQLEVEHRLSGAPLVLDEGGEGDEAADERHDDQGATPPVMRLLDQREDDSGQPDRAEGGAGHIDAATRGARPGRDGGED